MEDADRAAHAGDSRAGRPRVQYRFAAAAGQGAVRGNGAARAVPAGKGKAISTAADVLEALAAGARDRAQGAGIPATDQAEGHLCGCAAGPDRPGTGRLHTSFNQTGAATGRLSSSNPNLQNIPIKTELGREIRAAFVPREGWQLVVADYSQIELRLLAHMSEDPVLLDAFRNGEDIHTRTAAEVMGVPPMLVTKEARNNAKAVNFGIVYGISSFGLAANLGISRKEADTLYQGVLRAVCGGEALYRRDDRRARGKPVWRGRCSAASGPFRI